MRFSNPDEPLAYEYDGGFRIAETWTDKIRVRKSRGMEARKFTFRKTHHGPIVATEDDGSMLAAKICGIFETIPLRQALSMMRASNLEEFREAIGLMQILYMNVLYADCEDNIQFIYTGRIPRRNPDFDWTQPVDGGDPSTEWLGFHTLDELPQVLNPAAGFLQNCNSTPLMVTDGDNPLLEDFPPYMIGDANQYRRRALRSMQILRGMQKVTFEQLQAAALDTEVYWAKQELPRFAEHFQRLKTTDLALHERVKPYLEHLLAWDAQITEDSTAASLCHAWYEALHGAGYPGEQLREEYVDQPDKQLRALAQAAQRLRVMHGDWRVPYGELYRNQRIPQLADITRARFDDEGHSLPSVGGHGPMGTIFTQYYTPSIEIPWVITQRRRYGIVGTSYLAAYEFTPHGVRGASLVPFGTSGNANSDHFFDQAKLLQQQTFKPELFTRQEVLDGAERSYRPGEE